MSPKYKSIKNWYKKGFWTANMVKDAVKAKWLTEEECKEILGE